MATAFVVGNGISRKGLDLNTLKPLGKVYGCNALYREFTPDVLVATDKPISTAIQASGYATTNIFYTRHLIENSDAKKIPPEYYSFSSGPAAVGIAASDDNQLIYLIGFDIGPGENNAYNNMYENTEFYKTTGSQPIYTGNWIKQLKSIVLEFKSKQFVRVTGPYTAKVDEFTTLNNFQSLPLTSFLQRINTGRNP